MSDVALCPICGSKSKIKEKDGIMGYTAIQNEEAFKKIGQLKRAMERFKQKIETLEMELATIKSNN